jgi:hypothetical protein
VPSILTILKLVVVAYLGYALLLYIFQRPFT